MQGLKITAGLTFQQAIFLINIWMIVLQFKKYEDKERLIFYTMWGQLKGQIQSSWAFVIQVRLVLLHYKEWIIVVLLRHLVVKYRYLSPLKEKRIAALTSVSDRPKFSHIKTYFFDL